MSRAEWRIAGANVVGSSHVRTGLPCQDRFGYEPLDEEGDRALLLFAADGAGSAALAETGAEYVCDSFREHFGRLLLASPCVGRLTRGDGQAWLVEVRQGLEELAREQGAPLRDFACTFLGAIVGDSGSVFFQLGDGAMVFSTEAAPEDYEPAIWPEAGEYANITHFVTEDDAPSWLGFRTVEEPLSEIALFTDGLQHLALHNATQTAHAPFFRAFLPPLRSEPPGFSGAHSGQIAAFLGSPMVLERTDDDMTLLLASRRPAPPPSEVDEAG